MRIQEPAWLLTAGVVFVALLAAGSDAGKSVTVNDTFWTRPVPLPKA